MTDATSINDVFERFDRQELLALIEEELDANQTRSLRERLARDPEALTLIERMRSDRQRLRAMDAPELPGDFLADLEPMLARPMLMSFSTSDYRRAQQRRERRTVMLRAGAVIAAAIVLAAGLWTVAVGVRSVVNRQVADSSHDEPSGSGSIDALFGDRDGEVDDTATRDRLVSDTARGADGPAANTSATVGTNGPIDSGFVLVVRADDLPLIEQALVEVAVESERVALVRNFTFDEARWIEQELRLAGTVARDRRPDRFSGTSGGPDFDELLRRIRRLSSEDRRRLWEQRPLESDRPLSEHLAGPTGLAPTLDRQLAISEDGGTHTIAVRAGDLAALLSRLDRRLGPGAMLCVTSGDDRHPDPRDGEITWIRHLAEVRAAAKRLQASPDATVHLPVRLVEDGTRGRGH